MSVLWNLINGKTDNGFNGGKVLGDKPQGVPSAWRSLSTPWSSYSLFESAL
jgi:hypothetical protein